MSSLPALDRAVRWTLLHRVTVFVLVAMVAVVGTIATRRLPLEFLPRGLERNHVNVDIPVDAANPVEIMEAIVRPAEELLRTIPGVRRIESRASTNWSRINLEFAQDVDLNLATAEVRDRMERARLSWPPEVRRYRIGRFNLDTDLPIFQFGIEVRRPSDDLSFLVEERIIKVLEAVPGVARVNCMGLLDDQIRIFVNQERALASGVRLYELTRALEAGNVDTSGGEIEDGGIRYTVKSSGRFRSLEDLREFPIRPGLKLGQIATIEPQKAVRNRLALSRAEPTLWCQIQKESSANTVDTCDRIRQALARIAPDPRLKELGISFLFFDFSNIGAVVTSALGNLGETAIHGSWLSVLVLLFFLRRLRLTLLIGLAIPVSLLITGICIAAAGGTMNICAMVGITVAIGMLVDDAIVVVESIQHKREQGLKPMAAALRGTADIALAVVLSTLTTVVAFVPVMFLGGEGDISFWLKSIGMPLCYAVLGSLFVALVFIPLGTVVCYQWQRGERTEGLVHRLRRSALIGWLVDRYGRSLDFVLRRRFVSVLVLVIPIAVLTAVAARKVPKTDVMSDRGGSIWVEVDLDSNFSLKDAHTAFVDLGHALEGMTAEIDLRHFWCFFDRTGGGLWIHLNHKDVVRTREAAKKIKAGLPRLPGVKIQSSVDEDRSDDKKLTFSIYSDDVASLGDVAAEVAEVIESVPGVLRVKSELRAAEGELHVLPDREKLQRFGIRPEALWGTVQYGVRGFPLNELVSGDREIPLIIQFEGGEDQTLGELRETTLFSPTGAQVPMSAVAEVAAQRGYGEIHREAGRNRARLVVDASEKDTEEVTKRIRKALDAHLLPEGFSYEDNKGGEMETAMSQMKLAGLMSLIFVFLLMGIMFESFILPVAVVVAVPISWAGAVMALGFTGSTMDFVGMIALVLLIGIVVKNGIVLIDCAARLRASGMPRHEALVEAGRIRLRPIVMTALTTVLGLVPMALATETGSVVSYHALAVATIGGMVLATILTLYLTPITYAALDDLRTRFSANFGILLAKKAKGPAAPPAIPPA